MRIGDEATRREIVGWLGRHATRRPKGIKIGMPCLARILLALLIAAAGLPVRPAGGPGDAVAAPSRASARALADLQGPLLERALGGLLPAEAGPPRLYFVGFAGYGAEAVFKREVLAVRRLFDERFGTEGQSVALVNQSSTRRQFPLASVGNLDRVLQHLGQLMDANRDTLFLFLTSHGEDGVLAVQMPGLALGQLRPAQLKGMLDRSGIRNHVIVVSACHSGSFIPALAGPTTLVIAAARADRSSFGCEDKRPWTYFGDAYFNRALRHETSFRRAYERARRTIAAWEARDRLTPSLPQMAGGDALPDAN
jgi:hypothetical protein